MTSVDEAESSEASPPDAVNQESTTQIRAMVFWSTAVVAFFVLYFTVYPALIIVADDRNWLDAIPEIFLLPIEWTIIPIEWLMDNLEPYEDFIDWCDDKLATP